MTSPSDYRLGSFFCAYRADDEWFAQIVEPHLGGYRVVATAVDVGKENTLKKVCRYAGLSDPPPPIGTSQGVVKGGLLDALEYCGQQVAALTAVLANMNGAE